MASKTKPTTYRLGITMPWRNRWFFRPAQKFLLEEDYTIRTLAEKKLVAAGIAELSIERVGNDIRVTIKASRPGFIIGRGGKGIEELRDLLRKKISVLRRARGVMTPVSLHLNIEELKRTEISAAVVAQQIASDIERRVPYRTVLKRQLESLKQNRGILGAKLRVSGRLNGNEISRRDWMAYGSMPLQTLRALIDYGEATSYNTYGTIGVKVWIYKGETFEN